MYKRVGSDHYIFYSSKHREYCVDNDLDMFFVQGRGSWMVGSNPRSNSGWIKSVVKGLTRVPSRGWQYTDNGWRSDNTLKFLFDVPEEGTENRFDFGSNLGISDFPGYITVKSSGKASKKYPSTMGRYKLDAIKTLQGRPLYRKTDRDIYIFYNSEYNCDFMGKRNVKTFSLWPLDCL